MHVNLQNVEDFIFRDRAVRALLPGFQHLFDSWSLAQRLPALRSLGRRCVLDLLNGLKEEHLAALGEHFGTEVSVDKLDYSVVRNLETTVEGAVLELQEHESFLDMALYRNGDRLYISIWR